MNKAKAISAKLLIVIFVEIGKKKIEETERSLKKREEIKSIQNVSTDCLKKFPKSIPKLFQKYPKRIPKSNQTKVPQKYP